jgi:hypothetical protein
MEYKQYSKEEAITALQSLIQAWLDEKPKRNRLSLARETGVSETTIRRVMNDSVLPSGNNILKIVSYIKGVNTNKEILKSGGPILAKTIETLAPTITFESFENRYNLPYHLEQHLNSPTKRLLFSKASTLGRLNEDSIVHEFGHIGLMDVKELVSAGVLDLVENEYRMTKQMQTCSVSVNTLKDLMVETTRAYYNTESDYNYLFYVSAGVSSEAYINIMEVLKDAHQKISLLVENNPGDIPVFANAAMDKMSHHQTSTMEGK